jgi:hypothetical protein
VIGNGSPRELRDAQGGEAVIKKTLITATAPTARGAHFGPGMLRRNVQLDGGLAAGCKLRRPRAENFSVRETGRQRARGADSLPSAERARSRVPRERADRSLRRFVEKRL